MQDFIGAKGIIPKERLAELSERRDGPAFLYLAGHWGAIAANGAAMHYAWGTWWCVPLFLLQGLLINFLYAPQHECDHFTAFRTRRLNEARRIRLRVHHRLRQLGPPMVALRPSPQHPGIGTGTPSSRAGRSGRWGGLPALPLRP